MKKTANDPEQYRNFLKSASMIDSLERASQL
jgi:hypothetical protein